MRILIHILPTGVFAASIDASTLPDPPVSLEAERVRLKQKEAAAAAVDLRRRRTKPTARTLNFCLVPPVPQPPARFTYDFPFTPRNTTANRSQGSVSLCRLD
ncbi:hypothetical protein B0H14DRAFT_3501704 [Mycena olivaceomarginata]|nr:hypothetical protein B0H14DRAFT_3501704 [Mycena olivaceomarginata]